MPFFHLHFPKNHNGQVGQDDQGTSKNAFFLVVQAKNGMNLFGQFQENFVGRFNGEHIVNLQEGTEVIGDRQTLSSHRHHKVLKVMKKHLLVDKNL